VDLTKNRYIEIKDRNLIEKYCKMQVAKKQKIRVQEIVCWLGEKYCCANIMYYIKRVLVIEDKHIFHSEAKYYSINDNYMRLSKQDEYYSNTYYHQYVVHKELRIELEHVQKYQVHHIDLNRLNNDISNLFIFYDRVMHQKFHYVLTKYSEIDIFKYAFRYMNEFLKSTSNKVVIDEINQYLDLLGKLNSVHNKTKVDMPIF